MRPDLSICVKQRVDVRHVPALSRHGERAVKVPLLRPDGSSEARVLSPDSGRQRPRGPYVLLDLECPSADNDPASQEMLWSRLTSEARGTESLGSPVLSSPVLSSPTASLCSDGASPASRLLRRRLSKQYPILDSERVRSDAPVATDEARLWGPSELLAPVLALLCCAGPARTPEETIPLEYALVGLGEPFLERAPPEEPRTHAC